MDTNIFSFDTSLLGSSSDPTQTDSIAAISPPLSSPPVLPNSDAQSNGILGLLGSLGTAYLGATAPKPSTALSATGAVVPTTVIPGISNTAFVLGGLALVGGLVLFSVLRK